jgi:hypothetical protein
MLDEELLLQKHISWNIGKKSEDEVGTPIPATERLLVSGLHTLQNI